MMEHFFSHDGIFQRICLMCVLCISIAESIQRRASSNQSSRNLSGFGSEMGPEMLVHVLRGRGDNFAETNAHRILLSVDTASNFINDVLESAMTKTFHSAISSRENLFFSLQRINNDSRRIFELVDRATAMVSDTAKKAKTEINDAIKTSLDHLRESMKIIIRNVPESKLTENNLGAIIANGQYRMEVVVENSGQRIIDAIQSYRSHFIAIDKITGNIMVDPESSQEATQAVKHIITAAKSQIQEAVSGSTSFILSRIRECLSIHLNDDMERINVTTPTSVTVAITGSQETFQAEVINVHPLQMEDPQDDKLVQMGDMPKNEPQQTVPSTTSPTTTWELPMIINTRWTTASSTEVPSTTGTTVATTDSTSVSITAGSNIAPASSTTPKMVSWQDDLTKATFPDHSDQPVRNATKDGDLTSIATEMVTSTDGTTTTATATTRPSESSVVTISGSTITVTPGSLVRRRNKAVVSSKL